MTHTGNLFEPVRFRISIVTVYVAKNNASVYIIARHFVLADEAADNNVIRRSLLTSVIRLKLFAHLQGALSP